MPPGGAFVTGTDTGIGKTVVAACLVRACHARYWKPVQTGLAEEAGDTETVMRLAELPPGRVHAPRHKLAAPLSPEAAARREGVEIRLEDFVLPEGEGPLVAEGAGGVLVPLGGGALMIELMARLGLPALVVARTALGTINHTLLTLEALRLRRIDVLGVVMVGPDGEENAEAIARHSGARILAMLPLLGRIDIDSVSEMAELFDPRLFSAGP